MALITHGSFGDLTAAFSSSAIKARPSLERLRSFSMMREATRDAQPEPIEFPKSPEARGLALKSIMLTEGFEGLLQKVFNRTNEVYFTSLAWDLSGSTVIQYPGSGARADSCIIPLKVGKVREFMGVGINLFPARKVTAGITLRIQIWESEADARNFGKTLEEIAKTVKSSELNNLLTLIATGTGGTVATLELIRKAAIELMSLVGSILKANSDDYVDFYEGYFPVSSAWSSGNEAYQGHASEIQLTRFT
jgi:hypothetical protein